MLIVLPLGLLVAAVVFDAMSYFSGDRRWTSMAFYMVGAGVISGAFAAIFGIIDYFAIPPGTRARRIGMLHGFGNAIVLLLFVTSWKLRWTDPADARASAYLFSYVGGALALVTGWLGGELVDRLGIGVDTQANLNAPSSLKSGSRPA